MDTHEKTTKLVNDAQMAVALLGNLATRDFELVDLFAPCNEDKTRSLTARGMAFLGVAGIVDGLPRTSLETPLDNATIDFLAAAVLIHVEQNFYKVVRDVMEKKALEGWLMRLAVEDGGRHA